MLLRNRFGLRLATIYSLRGLQKLDAHDPPCWCLFVSFHRQTVVMISAAQIWVDLELPSSILFCSFHLSWYFFVKRAWMFWSSRIHEKVRFLKKDHQNGKRPVASPIVPRKAERTTSALLCKRAHFCAKARTSEKCAFSTLSFHQLQTESSTFLTNVRYFCNEQFLPKRAQKKTSRKECSLEASGRFMLYLTYGSPAAWRSITICFSVVWV